MHVINAHNVNDAYAQGVGYVCRNGQLQSSRAGQVLSILEPVTIVYERPQERVLLDPNRDANVFFHFFEALWMLSGRNDARWLDRFIHDFSERFAEDDGHQHGAYGFRWRVHFDVEGGGHEYLPDQLDVVVSLLREDPDNRRVVIQMWDPVADLGVIKKDLPCNLCVVPRIRREVVESEGGQQVFTSVLDITVFNRSNDLILGALGANAVHFAFLQEYLAGRVGVGVGRYYQISTNMHLYTKHLATLSTPTYVGQYPGYCAIGTRWDEWDADLRAFMAWVDGGSYITHAPIFANQWFANTAVPLFLTHYFWKQGQKQYAYEQLANSPFDVAPDWKAAALGWMQRRIERAAKNQKEELVTR